MPELSKKKSFADLRGLLINKNSNPNPKDGTNSNQNNSPGSSVRQAAMNSHKQKIKSGYNYYYFKILLMTFIFPPNKICIFVYSTFEIGIDPEVKKIADDFKNSPLIDEDVEIPEDELTPGQKK
jgi:hypothetical protein